MENVSKTEPPEVALLESALHGAVTQGASHIHIEPVDDDVAVRFRIGREYRDFAKEPCDVSTVMTRIRTLTGLSVVPPLGPEWGVIEFQNDGKTHRFATQMLPSVTGEKAIRQLLRETHVDPRRLDELGMLDDQLATLKSALKRRSGLIVLCGPAGSGLDTTAYASLLVIDRDARSVATIERVAQGQVPGVHRIEAVDVDEKNAMLRALMRTDTDVIHVQDLAGVESATLALSAAIEHQKLVMSSLHTPSAAAAVTHFVKLGIEPWLVGSGIALIQSQRLLRLLCAECREHAVVLGTPSPDGSAGQDPSESFASHRAVGCAVCHGLGYTDERILVCESMPFSDHLQQLVIEKASEDELQEEAVREGMTTLRAMALDVAREGTTTLNEVYLHTPPE